MKEIFMQILVHNFLQTTVTEWYLLRVSWTSSTTGRRLR